MFYSVQTFFWNWGCTKNCWLVSINIMLQATVSVKNITCHKWNLKVGSLFDLIPSQSIYPFVYFFLIINMSHLMQFSNISNLLQKDIPENWSDFIYLFIFFIPSVLFFLFVLFWSEHAYQLWICMVPLTGEQTSNIRKWN